MILAVAVLAPSSGISPGILLELLIESVLEDFGADLPPVFDLPVGLFSAGLENALKAPANKFLEVLLRATFLRVRARLLHLHAAPIHLPHNIFEPAAHVFVSHRLGENSCFMHRLACSQGREPVPMHERVPDIWDPVVEGLAQAGRAVRRELSAGPIELHPVCAVDFFCFKEVRLGGFQDRETDGFELFLGVAHNPTDFREGELRGRWRDARGPARELGGC